MKNKIVYRILTKKYFVLFFIFLSIIIFPHYEAKSEITSSHTLEQIKNIENPTTMIEELPPEVFSFQGVKDLHSPVKIDLKNDRIDLSFVIQAINRVKKSHYRNTTNIHSTLEIVFKRIKHLCAKSKNKTTCINNSKTELDNTYHNIREEMSKNILYSRWYGGDEQGFTEALNFLDSNCAANCRSYSIANSIISDSNSKYNQLYDKIKNKDKDCQMDILQAVAGSYSFYDFPKKCLEKESKNHPVCDDMLKFINTAKSRFVELVQLVDGEKALTTTETHTICLDCISHISHGKELSNALNDITEILQTTVQCRELKPNEKKKIRSGTGLDKSYTIKKEPDGSYSIPLVLNFSPTKKYNGPVPRDEVPEYYMNKVRTCMEQANQKMLGPNGEKLKINIQAPVKQNKNDCKKENVRRIEIGPPNIRSNSRKYESDIDCPTIAHEVLHLLGLCDEYKETKGGYYVNSETGEVAGGVLDNMTENEKLMNDENYEFKPAYNCRVVQNNSIMSLSYARWRSVYKFDENKSLLDPGHFNSILYGDCNINKNFNECSQLAYEDPYTKKNCIEKKTQCELQNILGKNKQEEIELIQTQIDRMYKSADNIKKGIKKFEASNMGNPIGGGIGMSGPINSDHRPMPVGNPIGSDMGMSEPINGGTGTIKNLKTFFLQKLDYVNKELTFAKEKLRIVNSWPDP